MKFSSIVLGLLLAGVAVAGVTVIGCGPENKFCPNIPSGMCPPPVVPQDDVGGGEDVRDTGTDRPRDRGRI